MLRKLGLANLVISIVTLQWTDVSALRSYVVLDPLGKPVALKRADDLGRPLRQPRPMVLRYDESMMDEEDPATTYAIYPAVSQQRNDSTTNEDEPDRAYRCWVCSSVPPEFFPPDQLPELTSAAKEVLDNPDLRRECHRFISMDQRGTSGRYGTLVRIKRGEGCLLVSRYADAHPLFRAAVVRDSEYAAALQNFGPTYMVNFCVCRSNECNIDWCTMSPAAMATARNPLIIAAVLFNSLLFSRLLFPQVRELGGYLAHVVYSVNGFLFSLIRG